NGFAVTSCNTNNWQSIQTTMVGSQLLERRHYIGHFDPIGMGKLADVHIIRNHEITHTVLIGRGDKMMTISLGFNGKKQSLIGIGYNTAVDSQFSYDGFFIEQKGLSFYNLCNFSNGIMSYFWHNSVRL